MMSLLPCTPLGLVVGRLRVGVGGEGVERRGLAAASRRSGIAVFFLYAPRTTANDAHMRLLGLYMLLVFAVFKPCRHACVV